MSNSKRFGIPKNVISGVVIITGCILVLMLWLWYTARYDGIALYPNTFSNFGNKSFYSINTNTILVELSQGEKDVFIQEVAPLEDSIFEQPINWSQSDYVKVSNVFYQVIWNESLENWNLYYLEFIANCNSNPSGFGFGEISFFKNTSNKPWLNNYTTRALQIIPQYGNVISADGGIFPQPLFDKWKSINLDTIVISADDALRIADENGGEEARLSVENNCTIQVRLSGYDNYWKVRISENNTASVIFMMAINPYTGEIK